MKELRIYASMIIMSSLIFCSLTFISCGNKYDKQFYGTYEHYDSSRFAFTRIKFYENGLYYFYAASCFYRNIDSGSFVLHEDTISFRSFNLPALDKGSDSTYNLTKFKFLYRSGKVLFIRHIPSSLREPSYTDTILIGQKKNRE